VPKYIQESGKDVESARSVQSHIIPVASDGKGAKAEEVAAIPPQKDVFTWRDVCLDITIKGEPRRLLDGVSGWVKPGTLTALMGVSLVLARPRFLTPFPSAQLWVF
jgi:ATP-binding cassette, subfamily G (WHITE), member 2, PDR